MLHMWFLSPHPIFVVVQSLSCVQLSMTPCTAACQASLSITNSQSLLKPMSIEFELKSITIHVGDAIQPSLPLSSPSPPCLQSFQASGSFLMSQLFASGGQSIETSASASVLTMNIQDWFPLGLTCLISLQSRDSQESSPTPHQKHQFFDAQTSSWSNFHIHTWPLEKS